MNLPPTILYEKRERVAIVTINRPERLNACTTEMYDALYAVFDDFNADEELWVAILTGAGERAFSAGGDLDEAIPRITAGEYKINVDPTKRIFCDVFKPIICAVNGVCIAGGVELMLGTDLRIAAEHATFSLGEVQWGMVPAGGSHIRLTRQIPWAVAMEMLLAARQIDARRAYDVGLVNQVVPLDQLMPAALELAEVVCKNGPLAVRTAKEIAVRSLNLEPGFVLEATLAARVLNSEDAREGPRAFMEKRRPRFTGR